MKPVPASAHDPDADVAVSLERVSHTYPDGLQALAPLDLAVRNGEFVCLLGPSGCGKSTLLRIVAGLTRASGGSARRAGDSAATGFVFQSPTLMPWASALDNVRLPLDLARLDRASADARARQALAQMGLTDFAAAYPRALSGGMQMRVSIARALVTRPRLLLMDEPFGALDEIGRLRLDQELSRLATDQGLTVLFVTHSVQEAAFLASRVLVMGPRPGRIAADVALDEPRPRTEAFRQSERFATLGLRLSRLLAEAAGP